VSERSSSRLPPAPNDDPRLSAIWESLARRGRTPLNLHRTLAHGPALLDAMLGLAETLRHQAGTPRRLRELIIVRVAQLEGSAYELAQHLPMARAAGVTDDELVALPEWRASPFFDMRERAALAWAESIAGGGDHAEAPQDHFTPAEIVELTVLAAFYLMTARIVAALAIRVEET
jgi:AhpD family alkylhydroperoxidase